MSMEVIKKAREEKPTAFSATQGVKGTPSLAALGIASEQLEALLQVKEMTKEDHRPLGALGGQKAAEEVSPSLTAVAGSYQLNDSGNKKKVEFTEKSIFAAAGEMSKLQTESNNSLEDQLKNQLAIMEAQLKAMQAIEQFWQKFGPAWKDYSNNPSYQNFLKVIHLLEQEYKNNPAIETFLEVLESWGSSANSKESNWQKREADWNSHSWWYHLWHSGPGSDPHAWSNFDNFAKSFLTQYATEAAGNPQLFANALTNGQGAFEAKIRQLFQSVQILMDIVKILEGSKGNSQTAMFDMEALLMDLEQLQINTNTQKSQQQQQISQTTAKNLQHNLKKIQDAIKKASEHHSGGLFGFLGDLFKGIAHLLEAAFDAFTGQESAASDAIKESGSDFKKVGKQLFNLVKLLGEAVLALGTLIVAGIAGGNKTLMDFDKKLGEDMLANPALKLLTDIAMVVIIAALAVTGNAVVAGIMLALFVASEAGWMQKGTEALANAIGGPDNAVAKVIADVIVIVAVTVLTAGIGAAEAALTTTAESVASVGEEEGIEMVNMAAREEIEEGADEAVDEAASQNSNPSRAAQIGKRAASMGAFGLGSTLGSSSLALDILKTTSKKDSEALAIILELIQVIVAAVTASIGGFSTMTQTLGNTAKAAESSVGNMIQLASRMQVAAVSVGAVSGAAQGAETIIQGQAEKKLTEYQANVTLDEATQNTTDAMIKQTGEELKQMIKGYEELIATAFKTPEEVANAELQALIQA